MVPQLVVVRNRATLVTASSIEVSSCPSFCSCARLPSFGMEQHVIKRKQGEEEESKDEPQHKKRIANESEDSEELFDDGLMSDFSESEMDAPATDSSSNDSGKGSLTGSGDQVTADSSYYGLPAKMPDLLKKYRRIDKLYEWQERLIEKLLSDNRNVIYCVPTSGGKTLVAELLLMRQLLLNKRDAILVLPFVSIVQEKMRAIRPFAESLGFAVEEYAGSRGSVPVKKHRFMRTIYVATIEKANVVIASLFEADRMSEIGLFVIDELHMIGDGSRGATLETLIVKTRLAAAKSGSSIRFLGMSATLTNFPDLSKFLDADVIKDNFRPVQLKEFVKIGDNLYDASGMSKGGEFQHMPLTRIFSDKVLNQDPENLRTLVGEVIPQKSVLVFCPTKKHCEDVAVTLSRLLPNRSDLVKYKKTEKERLIRAIQHSNSGAICHVLRRTLPFGVAYHHSGLTPDERQIVEEGFLKQVISCIVCTSTLAAGVNLPAERVVIRDPYVAREFISKSLYQQICGRAGRAGLCTYGESILICQPKDCQRVQKLLETGLPMCMSCLKDVPNGLSAFILTLIRLKFAETREQIGHIITTQTLSGIQYVKDSLLVNVSKCLAQLLQLNLVSLDETNGVYSVSKVGNGVVRSLIDVQKSLNIYEELKRAQAAMSLSNYLHLIFLTTMLMEESELPYTVDNETFLKSFDALSKDEKESAEFFGLNLGVVSKYMRPDAKATVIIRRFYVTLLVYEVWNRRTDLTHLADKYASGESNSSVGINDSVLRHNMQRGTLFSILGKASSCANAMLRFVEETGDQLWSFRRLLPDLCEALTHCCVPELMPLMKLPEIRIPRARQLYAAGFKDIVSIAKVKDHEELTKKIERLNSYQARSLVRAARHMIRSQRDELEQQVNELGISVTEEAGDASSPADDSFLQNFDV